MTEAESAPVIHSTATHEVFHSHFRRRSMRPSISLRSNLHMIIYIGVFAVAGAQAATLEEITVTAPTIKTLGRDATGTPIRELSATVRLQYNPISLTTHSGRALLDDKVTEVARGLCSAGGTLSNTDDNESCVRDAVKGAKSQLDAAAARQTEVERTAGSIRP